MTMMKLDTTGWISGLFLISCLFAEFFNDIVLGSFDDAHRKLIGTWTKIEHEDNC